MKRRYLRFFAWVLILAVLMSNVSYAGSWIRQDSVWYYQEDGMYRTGWVEDKGQWYYMDASGAMRTGWYKENSNDWYYLNTAADGVEGMMKTGWFLQDNTWYFLNTVHDGAFGRALTDGWYWIDGYCYLFDANGRMYADCTTPDGYEVNADGQWTVDGVAQFVAGKGIITKEETVVEKVWDWITSDGGDDENDSVVVRPTEPSTEEPSTEETEPSTEEIQPGGEPTDPENPGGEPTEPDDSDEPEKIEIAEECMELEVGMNYKLDPGISPEGIIWKSSDTSIAKVSALGTVFALSGGTVTITADNGMYTDSCEVTVIETEFSLSIDMCHLEIGEGQSIQVQGTDQKPEWMSSNPEIVSVSEDETGNATINAHKVGTATIWAAVDGRKESCIVNVFAKNLGTDVDISITRGEWILELLEATGYNPYVLDEDEIRWHYSDTEANNKYGLAIELAYINGMIPNESSAEGDTTFKPNDKVTREFAAVTGVRAMRYSLSGEQIRFADANEVEYLAEASVAVRQAMLSVDNLKNFRPNACLTGTEKEQFLSVIDNLKRQETELASLAPGKVIEESVKYAPDAIGQDELKDVTYDVLKEESDDSYVELILNNVDDLEIYAGHNLILPPNDEYMTGYSVYVENVEVQDDGSIRITGYPQTDITQLVEKITFKGTATPMFDEEYLEDSDPTDGITMTYNPEGTIDIPTPGVYGIDYGEALLDGTLRYDFENYEISDHLKINGSVTFEIPNITVSTDADFGLLSGIEINHFLFSITERLEVEGGITAEISSERYPGKEGSIELKRFPFALGTTGLFVDFVISFYYSAEGEVTFVYSVQATEGFAYENNDFRYIGDFWQDIQPLKLCAQAEAGLKPAANLSFVLCPDIIGVANEIGVAVEGSATTHLPDKIVCLDGKLYLSSAIELNDETLVGALLKELLDIELRHQYWNEDTSPLKISGHIENGQKVDGCTVYESYGTLNGYVCDDNGIINSTTVKISLMRGEEEVYVAYADSTTGHYSISNVRAGIYNVVITAEGYAPTEFRYYVRAEENNLPSYGWYLSTEKKTFSVSVDIINQETGYSVENVTYEVYWEEYARPGYYVPLYEGRCDGSTTISLPATAFYSIIFKADGYEEGKLYMISKDSALSQKIELVPEETGVSGGDLSVVIKFNPDKLPAYDLGWLTTVIYKDLIFEQKTDANDEIYYDVRFSDWEFPDSNDKEDDGELTITYDELEAGRYSMFVDSLVKVEEEGEAVSYIADAEMKVEIWLNDELLTTRDAPQKDGKRWHVFDYDTETGEFKFFDTMGYVWKDMVLTEYLP